MAGADERDEGDLGSRAECPDHEDATETPQSDLTPMKGIKFLEVLEVFDLEGNYLCDQERREFYDWARAEYDRTGKITRRVKTVEMFLMDPGARVYLPQRSPDKDENPGLYDNSVGGHIRKGEKPEHTLVRECMEELGPPLTVVPPEEFAEALRSRGDEGLKKMGIATLVREDPKYMSKRIKKDGGEFMQPWMTWFYVGYFAGPITMDFTDGENTALAVRTPDELRNELRMHRGQYTEDLNWMTHQFSDHLISVDELFRRSF